MTTTIAANTATTTRLTGATPSDASATLSGYASLGEKDFLKMLTAELRQQDPTAPVDQKEMIAQMAQFSALAGINTTNATLTGIAAKLDTLIAQQAATSPTATTPITLTGA